MQTQPHPYLQAFGETLGLDVPTRYTAETHALFNSLLAADASLTPLLIRTSKRTRWVCRGLAMLLMAGRAPRSGSELRQQLQFEAAVGSLVISMALVRRMKFLERCYCLIVGVLMVANSLMTQVEPHPQPLSISWRGESDRATSPSLRSGEGE
jgi:hypothetical protein